MSSLKRKICIYTSGRMEYGLLHGVMKEVAACEELELQILASGTHLSPEFGNTVEEMIQDGFKPDDTVEILVSSDTPVGICKSMGLALIGYGEALQRLKPDILVLLGDRFETFCMAAAAQICRIPVAHIHGGETTEGAIDEAFRHSITKMSHLHFTSTEQYRQRVIQLGEHPDRVFNVGALGVENIRNLPLLTKEKLEKDIGFALGDRYLLATFHPVTLEVATSEEQFKNLLAALDEVTSITNPSTKIIFTKANADTDGRIINQLIDDYVSRHKEKAVAFTSMGQLRYLSAMKYAAALVGNSSSGIVEAPSFKVPTVNIGDRQKGRIRATTVIDCRPFVEDITQAIRKATSRDFVEAARHAINPYEKQGTAKTITVILIKTELSQIRMKSFFDVRFEKS